jgi:hypothetical protein
MDASRGEANPSKGGRPGCRTAPCAREARVTRAARLVCPRPPTPHPLINPYTLAHKTRPPSYDYAGSNLPNTKYYVRCVRGNPSYGVNAFKDNGDSTITDTATGLMWQKVEGFFVCGLGRGGRG